MSPWALVGTVKILCRAELLSADAAQHRWLVPLARRPYFSRVAGQRVVAIFAGVVNPAASHFNSDDVECCAIVRASVLGVQPNTSHGRTRLPHGYRVEDSKGLYILQIMA